MTDCLACGSVTEFVVLGTLGKMEWHQCRDCGMQFYEEAEQVVQHGHGAYTREVTNVRLPAV